MWSHTSVILAFWEDEAEGSQILAQTGKVGNLVQMCFQRSWGVGAEDVTQNEGKDEKIVALSALGPWKNKLLF